MRRGVDEAGDTLETSLVGDIVKLPGACRREAGGIEREPGRHRRHVERIADDAVVDLDELRRLTGKMPPNHGRVAKEEVGVHEMVIDLPVQRDKEGQRNERDAGEHQPSRLGTQAVPRSIDQGDDDQRDEQRRYWHVPRARPVDEEENVVRGQDQDSEGRGRQETIVGVRRRAVTEGNLASAELDSKRKREVGKREHHGHEERRLPLEDPKVVSLPDFPGVDHALRVELRHVWEARLERPADWHCAAEPVDVDGQIGRDGQGEGRE